MGRLRAALLCLSEAGRRRYMYACLADRPRLGMSHIVPSFVCTQHDGVGTYKIHEDNIHQYHRVVREHATGWLICQKKRAWPRDRGNELVAFRRRLARNCQQIRCWVQRVNKWREESPRKSKKRWEHRNSSPVKPQFRDIPFFCRGWQLATFP